MSVKLETTYRRNTKLLAKEQVDQGQVMKNERRKPKSPEAYWMI